jgi:hypothetical protein
LFRPASHLHRACIVLDFSGWREVGICNTDAKMGYLAVLGRIKGLLAVAVTPDAAISS